MLKQKSGPYESIFRRRVCEAGKGLSTKSDEKILSSRERKIQVRNDDSSTTTKRSWDYLNEMDRMLDDFRSRLESTFFPFVDPWMMAGRSALGLPQVRHAYTDLIDAGNEYRVMVEVPGISKERLNVSVTNRDVKIEGEAQMESQQTQEGYVRRERGFSKIQTSVSFPDEVLPDTAQASLNNGMLEVRVQKKNPTQVRRRRVEVT